MNQLPLYRRHYTHHKYRIRNPYRLASGNRWLQHIKALINDNKNKTEGGRV